MVLIILLCFLHTTEVQHSLSIYWTNWLVIHKLFSFCISHLSNKITFIKKKQQQQKTMGWRRLQVICPIYNHQWDACKLVRFLLKLLFSVDTVCMLINKTWTLIFCFMENGSCKTWFCFFLYVWCMYGNYSYWCNTQ